MKEKKMYFKYKIDILKALSDKGYNYYVCRTKKIIGQSTLAKIRRGESISLNNLAKICTLLGYREISDIVEIIPDDTDTTP